MLLSSLRSIDRGYQPRHETPSAATAAFPELSIKSRAICAGNALKKGVLDSIQWLEGWREQEPS
ncbi:hypothetical protein NKJ06_34150 [Mesorhizobium sp. M0293]|uniref:hypothetical protein n=1 Tax=Mesorhizobium sp. M0293 TaxID=2956930 RepID=UPI0033376F6E